MSRAVHGFQSKQLLLHLKGEHVLAIVLPVARRHPESAVVDVWGDHLLESSFPIFALLENKHDTHVRNREVHTSGGRKIERAVLYYPVKFKMHMCYNLEIPPGGIYQRGNSCTHT